MGGSEFVRKNDTLLLTDQEAAGIERDKDQRFELVTAKARIPAPGSLVAIPSRVRGGKRHSAHDVGRWARRTGSSSRK